MKQVVEIRFKDLKSTMIRMSALFQRTLGEKNVHSRTSIDDLGVMGQDWNSFLEEYKREFGVELDGLDYSKYFNEEVLTISEILLLPFRLVRVLILSLIGRRDLIMRKPSLTIGDLILSVHAKRFVKREDVEIRLT